MLPIQEGILVIASLTVFNRLPNNQEDLLKLLALPPAASWEDAKEAYEALLNAWHPDMFLLDPVMHQRVTTYADELTEAVTRLREFYPEATEDNSLALWGIETHEDTGVQLPALVTRRLLSLLDTWTFLVESGRSLVFDRPLLKITIVGALAILCMRRPTLNEINARLERHLPQALMDIGDNEVLRTAFGFSRSIITGR